VDVEPVLPNEGTGFLLFQGGGPKRLSIIAKNVGFLIRNVPFASNKAEDHFNKAIEVAEEIGAKGLLGQGYLNLGLLHKAKGKTEQAKRNKALPRLFSSLKGARLKST
jgi:hypothetical protein